MKVKELFEQIDGARGLCDKCMDRDVKIHVTIDGRMVEAENIVLTRIVYKFNPWLDSDEKGTVVLDLEMKL